MGEGPEAAAEENRGGDGGELCAVGLDDGGSVGEFDEASDGGGTDGEDDWAEAHCMM